MKGRSGASNRQFRPGDESNCAAKDPPPRQIPGGRTCTIEEGDRLPATSAKGNMWKYSK